MQAGSPGIKPLGASRLCLYQDGDKKARNEKQSEGFFIPRRQAFRPPRGVCFDSSERSSP